MSNQSNQFSLAALKPAITLAHSCGRSIVLATGVFDLLHQEHHRFLTKAKRAGDLLIVGLESDLRVKQLKGPSRPINSQLKRAHALQQLSIADHIFILPEQFSSPADHRRLVAAIKPNILAVSSHSPHLDRKQAILAQFGGRVKVVHQHNPAISTTHLVKLAKLSKTS